MYNNVVGPARLPAQKFAHGKRHPPGNKTRTGRHKIAAAGWMGLWTLRIDRSLIGRSKTGRPRKDTLGTSTFFRLSGGRREVKGWEPRVGFPPENIVSHNNGRASQGRACRGTTDGSLCRLCRNAQGRCYVVSLCSLRRPRFHECAFGTMPNDVAMGEQNMFSELRSRRTGLSLGGNNAADLN